MLVAAIVVAALGAGLVFVYAQSADNRALAQVATTPVLVASQPIAAGESASDAYNTGKIVLQDVPTTSVLADATGDGNAFVDQVALVPIYPGEQLITDKFGTGDQVQGKVTLPIPDGDIAVQIALSETGKVGSFTQPGSHVVIFTVPTTATVTGGSALPTAQVLLPDVLVLAVGSTTQQTGVTDAAGNPLPVAPTTNLTLALNQKHAEIIIGAGGGSGGGTLYFGLLGDKSKIKTDATSTSTTVGG